MNILAESDIQYCHFLSKYLFLSEQSKASIKTLIFNDVVRINMSFALQFLKKPYFTLARSINSYFFIHNGYSLIMSNTVYDFLNACHNNTEAEFNCQYILPTGFPQNEILMIEIELSNFCNLNCKYCYVCKDSCETISKKVLDDIATFIGDTCGNTSNHTAIQFFGGEPLANFDLIKYFIDNFKTVNKNIKYCIQTNGTLLNQHISEYLASENIGVGISSDGTPEVNSSLRTGCYSESINIESAIESSIYNGIFGGIISVLTKLNLEFEKYSEYWTSQYGDISVKMSPLLYIEEAKSNAISLSPSKQEIKELLSKLCEVHETNTKFTWQDYISTYEQLLFLELNDLCTSRGCRAANNFIAINKNGDVYPCTHLFSFPDMRITSIYDANSKQKIVDFISKSKSMIVNDCHSSSCSLWPFCRGGCLSQELSKSNGEKHNYCYYRKELFSVVAQSILRNIEKRYLGSM